MLAKIIYLAVPVSPTVAKGSIVPCHRKRKTLRDELALLKKSNFLDFLVPFGDNELEEGSVRVCASASLAGLHLQKSWFPHKKCLLLADSAAFPRCGITYLHNLLADS